MTTELTITATFKEVESLFNGEYSNLASVRMYEKQGNNTYFMIIRHSEDINISRISNFKSLIKKLSSTRG